MVPYGLDCLDSTELCAEFKRYTIVKPNLN